MPFLLSASCCTCLYCTCTVLVLCGAVLSTDIATCTGGVLVLLVLPVQYSTRVIDIHIILQYKHRYCTRYNITVQVIERQPIGVSVRTCILTCSQVLVQYKYGKDLQRIAIAVPYLYRTCTVLVPYLNEQSTQFLSQTTEQYRQSTGTGTIQVYCSYYRYSMQYK